ncbi:MAG: hypothetical protein OEM91_11535 [Hyphomicrobiales bacterium]|nr:hypothetical protein [Hyphomicrobiales bacterium]
MKHEGKCSEGFTAACANWWKSVAGEARARALESLEQRPMIACPGPPLGVARFALLATLFQPSATLPSAGAGPSSSGIEV